MAKWIYLLEGARRELDEVKGPVPRRVLVELIQSGRLPATVIVAPTTTFDANGLFAWMWPEMLQGLAADVPGTRSVGRLHGRRAGTDPARNRVATLVRCRG
jgi:hypothetical protein